MIGVILNLLLFGGKFIAGKISGSVAIVADAYNNLTDAFNVMLTSIGVQIAKTGPGKKHPDGHGKFEWIFAFIASLSVLLVGWELFKDSLHAIKNPQSTVFSWITLVILLISIGVKIFLYIYNRNKSKEKNLLSLKAVAIDSLSDAFSTTAVLLSLLLNTWFSWKVDGYFGVAVAILIMYNSIKSLTESIRSIVGTAASSEEIKELEDFIKKMFENPIHIYNTKIADNGYNRHTASFNLVSSDSISSERLLISIPLIQKRLYDNFGYDSIIQVEKAANDVTSKRIIETACERLKSSGLTFKLTDTRVLLCQNGTYQLSATLIAPFMAENKYDDYKEKLSAPQFYGLSENDSVLLKICLHNDDEDRERERFEMHKQIKNKSSKQKSEIYFDRIAKDYDSSNDGKFVSVMYGKLNFELEKLRNGNLLDLGCGNGNTLYYLKDKSFKLYGADLSKNMVSEAQNRLGEKAQISVMDAENLSYQNELFDVICCNASFHHYPHPEKALSEMKRVIKKDGIIFIGEMFIPSLLNSILNCFIKFSDEGDYHIYSKKQMTRLLLHNGFTVLNTQKTGKHSMLYTIKPNI